MLLFNFKYLKTAMAQPPNFQPLFNSSFCGNWKNMIGREWITSQLVLFFFYPDQNEACGVSSNRGF